MAGGRQETRHAVFTVPTGTAIAVCRGDALAELSLFAEPGAAEASLEALETRSNRSEGDAALARVRGQIEEYFAGGRREFDLPLDLRGTPFQREVWLALLDVPFGATTTYGELAARLGRPGAMRAVGAANGRNPVAIVVPCHRIVGADGSLTGYAAGLGIKRALLAHEGALPAGLPLFDRPAAACGAANEPDPS